MALLIPRSVLISGKRGMRLENTAPLVRKSAATARRACRSVVVGVGGISAL